jgi:hypothetical protein
VIPRSNAKAEKALREALSAVARAEDDQITAALEALNDSERTAALGLAMTITCYVVIDACGSQWPEPASVQRIAGALATKGSVARRLLLDAGQIHAYLSRVVLGPDRMEEVIRDEPQATRLSVVVAQRALVVYSPEEMEVWEYLDQIESAIEVASALDDSVLPAAVMRAYLPQPEADRTTSV